MVFHSLGHHPHVFANPVFLGEAKRFWMEFFCTPEECLSVFGVPFWQRKPDSL